MKLSIVTVVYNGAAVLDRTLRSVLEQQDVEVEYIVLDGGSTDGTVELLRQYADRLAGWTSEADRGIYDAMNKGLHRATGQIIAFLNADDVYAHDQVLALVAEQFSDPAIGAVYGDLVYVNEYDQVVRYWQTRPFSAHFFARGDAPPHPAFFARRDLLIQSGGFRPDLMLAADYELMFRTLTNKECQARYLPEVLVRMRAGGASNNGWRSILQGLREMSQAWRLNGKRAPRSLWLLILYRRLNQRRDARLIQP